MDTYWGVPFALWGGIVGSTLTYGITYWRERRKLEDAFRVPQREAIGQILAAANELKVSSSDILEQVRNMTSHDAAAAAQRNFEHAILEVERAFAIGRLNVVHPKCYEQMMIAYNEYSGLRRSRDLTKLNQIEQYERFMSDLEDYTSILNRESMILVRLGQRHLSPKQGWWATRQFDKAKARLTQRYSARYPDAYDAADTNSKNSA